MPTDNTVVFVVCHLYYRNKSRVFLQFPTDNNFKSIFFPTNPTSWLKRIKNVTIINDAVLNNNNKLRDKTLRKKNNKVRWLE